jgi:hypothetical protein
VACENKCCSPRLIPNRIDIKWTAIASSIFPYTSDQIAAITGYVLNNSSSTGPITIHFIRGGVGGTPLPFFLTVEIGEYKSFTTVGIDTIQINSGTNVATGELNITVNFNPF